MTSATDTTTLTSTTYYAHDFTVEEEVVEEFQTTLYFGGHRHNASLLLGANNRPCQQSIRRALSTECGVYTGDIWTVVFDEADSKEVDKAESKEVLRRYRDEEEVNLTLPPATKNASVDSKLTFTVRVTSLTTQEYRQTVLKNLKALEAGTNEVQLFLAKILKLIRSPRCINPRLLDGVNLTSPHKAITVKSMMPTPEDEAPLTAGTEAAIKSACDKAVVFAMETDRIMVPAKLGKIAADAAKAAGAKTPYDIAKAAGRGAMAGALKHWGKKSDLGSPPDEVGKQAAAAARVAGGNRKVIVEVAAEGAAKAAVARSMFPDKVAKTADDVCKANGGSTEMCVPMAAV
jgi:hypothetical protein